MTQYEADLARLATQLARMAADPTVVSAATDPAAVDRARLGVRRWCRAVLDDVAPAQHVHIAGQPGLADLAHRPIGVLRALLGHDPPPLEPYPSLPPTPLPGEYAANEQWQTLLGAAEVASHEWSSSDPASRPTGEQAWATVADVAAIAEAGALLDRDLAAGHPDKQGTGWTRDGWEIAVAAAEVRQLAADGPLLSATPLRPAPHRLKPVSVRSIDTLAPALANLAALVTAANHLGPSTVGTLAATHARTVRTLAGALAGTGPPAQRAVRKQLATSLGNHADMLVNVQVAGRRLQSLEPDDPRPALQMQEIRGGLRQLGAGTTARLAFRPARHRCCAHSVPRWRSRPRWPPPHARTSSPAAGYNPRAVSGSAGRRSAPMRRSPRPRCSFKGRPTPWPCSCRGPGRPAYGTAHHTNCCPVNC